MTSSVLFMFMNDIVLIGEEVVGLVEMLQIFSLRTQERQLSLGAHLVTLKHLRHYCPINLYQVVFLLKIIQTTP